LELPEVLLSVEIKQVMTYRESQRNLSSNKTGVDKMAGTLPKILKQERSQPCFRRRFSQGACAPTACPDRAMKIVRIELEKKA
tara:strand:+ start:529 stop:777 length:249 start_codon:yes stop_codon:yes gene_type:complete